MPHWKKCSCILSLMDFQSKENDNNKFKISNAASTLYNTWDGILMLKLHITLNRCFCPWVHPQKKKKGQDGKLHKTMVQKMCVCVWILSAHTVSIPIVWPDLRIYHKRNPNLNLKHFKLQIDSRGIHHHYWNCGRYKTVAFLQGGKQNAQLLQEPEQLCKAVTVSCLQSHLRYRKLVQSLSKL